MDEGGLDQHISYPLLLTNVHVSLIKFTIRNVYFASRSYLYLIIQQRLGWNQPCLYHDVLRVIQKHSWQGFLIHTGKHLGKQESFHWDLDQNFTE